MGSGTGRVPAAATEKAHVKVCLPVRKTRVEHEGRKGRVQILLPGLRVL